MSKKISVNIFAIAIVVLMTAVSAIVAVAQNRNPEIITVASPKAVPVVIVEKEFANNENISITNESYSDISSQIVKADSIKNRGMQNSGKIYLPKSFEEASRIAELKYGMGRRKTSVIKTSVIDGRTEKEISSSAKTEMKKEASGVSFLASVIYHSNGKSDLSNRDLEVLKKIASIVKEKNGTIKIVGHASSRTANMSLIDNKMVNYNISIERAERIKKELVVYGVNAKDISLVAVSDTEPVNQEVMPMAENVNRRSEIYISY
ncbi:MAG: OmpA family protein [Rickettsiales bacterium]|nr:OmpA family protein [Rickettsiales bacterium]